MAEGQQPEKDPSPPPSTAVPGAVDDMCPASFANSLQEFSTFIRQTSCLSSVGAASLVSGAFSDARFAEPQQTMVVFDWDETLFPTTEFCERWGVTISGATGVYAPECPRRARWLKRWREALEDYLEQAVAGSERVVIVTNSFRPWVSECIARFCPNLQQLLERRAGVLRIVYANGVLRRTRTRMSQILDLRPVVNRAVDLAVVTPDEQAEELTMAKYAAMKREAEEFYSLYSGQTWKNILSIGDMRYERDALQELAFKRRGPKSERLRTKTIVVPTEPTLSEITLRLCFSTIMLPVYIHFDGDIDVDLTEAADPLLALSEALRMPEIRDLSFSRHAWGLQQEPSPEEMVDSLTDLAVTVHVALRG